MNVCSTNTGCTCSYEHGTYIAVLQPHTRYEIVWRITPFKAFNSYIHILPWTYPTWICISIHRKEDLLFSTYQNGMRALFQECVDTWGLHLSYKAVTAHNIAGYALMLPYHQFARSKPSGTQKEKQIAVRHAPVRAS